jgi:hypothetical protein
MTVRATAPGQVEVLNDRLPDAETILWRIQRDKGR